LQSTRCNLLEAAHRSRSGVGLEGALTKHLKTIFLPFKKLRNPLDGGCDL